MGRKKKDFHDKKKKDFLQDCANASNMEMFKYVYLNNEKTNFMISSKGRIFSLNFNKSGEIKELKTTLNKDGHKQITLKFKGKNYSRRIHRLVAEAFIPNPENKPEVHHIDGDSLNNDYINLMWVTEKEHKALTSELDQYDKRYGEDSPVCKYSNEQITKVCELLVENKKSLHEISELTGVPYPTINLLRNRKESRLDIKQKYDLSNYSCFKNHKYEESQIHNVCELLTKNSYSDKEISNMTKVDHSTVKMIRLGKRWTKISKNYNFNRDMCSTTRES